MNVLRLHSRRPGAAGHDATGAAAVAPVDFTWRVVSPASGVLDSLARPAGPGAVGSGRGALVMECRFDDGLHAARTLLRCRLPFGERSATGQAFDLALIADPLDGIGLFLRRDGGEFRARAAWPGDGPPALLRLMFHWDIAADDWTLAAEDCIADRFEFASGSGAVALPISGLGALCAAGMDARDPAVVWLALAEGRAPFGRRCCLGADAMVLTPGGHVAAARLGAGDMVITRDRGAQPVRAAGVVEQPAYGANVPVILRANYLGAQRDLRILAQQRIAVAGAEVEYLFGEDEVLVEAGYFVDDRRVTRGCGGGSVGLAFVLLDQPDLISANGCWVESLWRGASAGRTEGLAAAGLDEAARGPVHGRTARRVLKDYEARTLAALRRQAGRVI